MAVSGSGKGKGKLVEEELSEGGSGVRRKGKKAVFDNGKNAVRDDDEEEESESEEYVADEAEVDSSGDDIGVRRKKRHKRYKETFELDEEDYDLLEDANVKGVRRPSNLGGKFKRLRKAGYVPGGKDSGTGSREIFEEEESEESEESEDEEEVVDDASDEEVGGYELLSKSRKKGGRQAPGISRRSRRGVQKRDRTYKPPSEGRRKFDREALGVLNEEGVDSDDNGGNDQETLSRRLLERQFEPSLDEVNYITARDDRLRQTDVPERLQILEEKTADVLLSSDLELRQSAEWIFERAFGALCVPSRPDFQHLVSLEKKPETVTQIANVLHLLHYEKLEVPFIGLYRREECLDLLYEPTDGFSSFDEGPTIQEYKALWTVFEWNKKWLLFQRRKSALQVNFKERIPVDFSGIPEKDKIAENILRFLEDAESEQALDDCEAQFNLHFPIDESEVADCGFKRPRFRSLYSIGRQSGLGKITRYFGMTSEAFGDNVKSGYKRNGILDEAFLPDDLAVKFFTGNTPKAEFRDPTSLLRGARHMLAMEISTEPLVREYVRTFYSNNALVTTRPTPVGICAIGAFHQFESVKWISDKPVSAFEDEQWLLIQKAEEEKLIDVTVGLSKESINTILFDFEQLFSSDGSSRTSPTWSEQRKQILQEAVVTLLLPIMEKETRMSLVVRAKQSLVAKCGLQLWNKVSVAPPKSDNLDCRNEDGPALRVLACCWGPPKVGATFVMLGADGEILNIMHTGYLSIKALSPEQAQRKENDQARLVKVLLDYKPHIIVLGAAKVQCRYLSQEISDVLFKVVEQHARDLSEGLDSTKLVYGDEAIPSLYEASRISQKQLPGKQGVVRRAVALGRFLQNPVAMVASLCGPSMEVLSIKFHPLQSFLSKEELYDIIERVMVTVVNQVGIDINLAVMHDWLFETLQFVAGLGPRKAEEIRRTLQTEGRVLTRNDLCSTVRAMGEKVFTNSAGFIRVRGIGQTSSDVHRSEPLDNTRIHPEWYQMSKNLADAAIEKEAKRNNEEDGDLSKMAVEYVMKNPNILDSVDIEEYAQSVQIEGLTKRHKALDLIKPELQRGFREWRKPYVEPSQEECFYLMTGESKDTLFEGRIVQATVRKVQEHQLMCVLECGLLGFIQKDDLSDDGDVEPKDKFIEGSSVTCRVKEVKKDKYLVDLTCKESDLREDSRGDLRHCDKHFKPDTTFLLNEQEKTRKNGDHNKKSFKTRPIIHTRFQNLSTDDAIKALAENDTGDFIIHPSSKGPAHLSIAFKLSNDLFSHIDIAEGGKDNWDLASFLRLGKTLTIGDDSYKDLDEVISKHVNKIVTHLNAILNYRKYKEGSKSEISDALRSEKTEKPKCIPYCISMAHEFPGAFMLSYVKATNPYHEYISLVPSGFRFRKQVFDSVDKLIVYFQNHFHDPMPEASNRGRGGHGSGERGVCYAFQRGECTNGDGCKFLHEKQEERPRRVCYAFQRGDCTNGDECKFLHEKQEERPRRVCYAFQRGDCTNGDECKFLHEKQEERPRRVCYAFQRGDCTNGDECKFLHEKQEERPRGVCYAFQRGDCPNGDDCKFSHEKQNEGGREVCRAFQRGACSRGDGCRFAHGEDDERPRGVCYAFQRGDCPDGDECKFSHEKQDERPRGVCYAFQRGDCTNGGDCKFSHEKQNEGGREVCRAFQRGDCSRGDGCRFAHGEDDERPRGVCYAFQRGDCPDGDECKFSHEKQDDRPRGVCYAFQRGDCPNGDECKFSHEKQNEGGREVCRAFQRGDCSRGDGCRFAHGEDDERPRGVCYAFQRGDCPDGDECKFSHEKQDDRPRGVCYAFQRGDCTNGDECKFSHEKQDERPRGVCYAFQRGDCTNGDECKFLHEKQEERPRGVCYAFQRGDCTNGGDCKFSHEKQNQGGREVCRAFQRGNCSRGDGCRFAHGEDDERPRGVCYAFQRGDCPNGDECKFSHEKQDERPRGVCYAFQRGDCSRGDGCRFAHDKQDEGAREVCRAFKRGDCSRGDGCRFAHDKQDEGPQEVCRAFKRGDCSRGDGCRYAHDEQENTNIGWEGGGAGVPAWGHDRNGGAGNDSWGDDRGATSDTKGWNDAGGEGGSAWGDKGGISSTEGEADGWGAKNVAGRGGGGWENWNDSADKEGGASANAARGEGLWDSCNDPADGRGSVAINAASGGGGWDIGKSKGDDVTQISGGDSAWDGGKKSISREDEGWASVPESGGGWEDVGVGHNNVSVNRSGGSDKGRWNENAGARGEKSKRWGSDLCPPSPAKRRAHNSLGDTGSTPAADGVGSSHDGGKPASNITTTMGAWESVANSAGGGGETVSAPESGGWDAVQPGGEGGFNSHGSAGENRNQIGRDGRSDRRGRDQDVAGRQEGPSGSWESDLPPGSPSGIPVQDSLGVNSKTPPPSSDDGWGLSAEKVPDSTVVSGGDTGWGEPVHNETESAGTGWDAVDAVVDPLGSGGGGHTTRRG